MNNNLIQFGIFFLAFSGLVFIHEFGHYIVSRLFGVEVEEFGFGLPPRMLTFWRNKGYLIVNDQRVEIPANFNKSFDWQILNGQQANVTADRINDRLILRTLESTWEEKSTSSKPLNTDHIMVDAKGQPVETQSVAQKTFSIGSVRGEMELNGIITETHPGTAFTLNWLPIGGFVRPKGENDPGIKGGLAAARPGVRLSVLFAGPIMNLLLGIVVFSFLFYNIGIPDFTQIQIIQVGPNSPAEMGGIQANDVILSANGEKISDGTRLHDVIYGNLDQPIQFTVRRGNETITLTATPSSKRSKEQGALGISMGTAMVRPTSTSQVLRYGALAVYEQSRALVLLPAQLIRGQLNTNQSRFVGLKGIYDIFGQAINRDMQSREPVQPSSPSTPPQTPTFFTIQLIGILTVTLGIFNLFPFPALDGGRIIFVLPELIFRRRVKPEFENLVHGLGMAILLLFMLYVNLMDFINPITTTLP